MSIKLSTLTNATNTTAWPGASLCLKWVQDVYENSGVQVERLGSAKAATQKWLKIRGVDNIKGGMAIGFLGNTTNHKYGHIGIYLGNNTVKDSETNGIVTHTLDGFVSAFMAQNYGAPYCGWFGGVEVTNNTNTVTNTSGGFDMSTLKTLSKGSTGTQVKVLQSVLNNLYNCKLVVDGVFGDSTKYCVGLFQSKHGLTKDYIVGKNTWTKLLGA